MPNNKNIEYKEISSAKVTEKRTIVISSCSKGGFTIAQRMDVEENDKTTPIYMKGAFHIDSVSGLYSLRDAINLAIEDSEQNEKSNVDWD